MSRWWIGGLLLALLLDVGCQRGPAKPNAAESLTEATGEKTADGEKRRGLFARPEAKSVDGLWGFVVPQQVPGEDQQPVFRDLCLALVKIDAAKSTAEVVAGLPGPQKTPIDIKCTAARIVEKDVALDLLLQDAPVTFEGKFDRGVVLGALIIAQGQIIPAALLGTHETTYEGWDPTPLAGGQEEFFKAMQAKEQPASILDFARHAHGSPLSLNAYQMVVDRFPQVDSLSATQIREICESYLKSSALWGKRMEQQARVMVALSTARTRRFPELAREFLDAADKEHVDTPAGEALKLVLSDARELVQVDLQLKALVDESDAAGQAKAFEELQKRPASRRFVPDVLKALGDYALNNKQPQLAKEFLADLVALPMLEQVWQMSQQGKPPGDPTPRQQLLKLWETEKGSVEGFDEFLVEIYHKRIQELHDAARTQGTPALPEGERKRTVLMELFTGAQCPPCVGADLALTTIQGVYPSSNLIVLRYHQHIPAPDPLANQDAEDRAVYYQVDSTPTIRANGLPMQPIAGPFEAIKPAYNILRETVDPLMKTGNEVHVTAEARLESGVLKVTAQAEGVPDEQRGDVRLRLALAETEIDWKAPNGVRTHEFVVREMLGGAKGTGFRGGKLSFSSELPMAELKKRLEDYLQQFEAGRGVEFREKPLKLSPLSLVVWVQHEQTKEVLQVVTVPVAGSEVATTDQPATAPVVEGAASALVPDNTTK